MAGRLLADLVAEGSSSGRPISAWGLALFGDAARLRINFWKCPGEISPSLNVILGHIGSDLFLSLPLLLRRASEVIFLLLPLLLPPLHGISLSIFLSIHLF